jgi:type II secretory pathway pseudopilin PulG
MGAIRRIKRSLRTLAQSESGFALPTVLMVIIIGMGFSAAAITASISAQSSSVRDKDSKTAFAAADAGLQEAVLRQNKIVTTDLAPCVVQSGLSLVGGALPAPGDGWCAPHTGHVGDASFSYRVKPVANVTVNGQLRRQVTIVSTGCVPAVPVATPCPANSSSSSVSRRVSMVASAVSGSGVFGNERAVGIDSLHEGTGNGKGIFTDAGSNGNVSATNSGQICGNIRHGTGHTFTGAEHQCGGYTVNEGSSEFPPVDISGALATNDNIRLSNGQDTKSGSPIWNPVARTLVLNGNDSVTLGGSTYVFCRLELNGNGDLIMAKGAEAKIYFDSPEACGLSTPATQISTTGNSSIVATGWDPAHGLFELPGIFMVGSSAGCSASFNGNAKANEIVVYAPQCDITIDGSSDYWGATLGKTLDVTGAARVFSDVSMPNPEVSVVLVYTRDRYVECGRAGTAPDANC